jgi:hypothetical protein
MLHHAEPQNLSLFDAYAWDGCIKFVTHLIWNPKEKIKRKGN